MLFVVVWVVATQWSMVAWEPLFSESYTQLELVAGFDSMWRSFDPALVPFRPLQHLTFWCLHHGCDGSAVIGRALSHAMHAGSALLVFAIATRLGAGPRGAWLALLAFLAFPSAKALTWVAAISGPARTLCLLWFVWATVVRMQQPSRALARSLGWTSCVVFVLALGFHQSTIVAPAIVALGIVCLSPGGVRERARALTAALRSPSDVLLVLLAVGYFVYVASLQARSYHGFVQSGAVAANVARASLALFPEWLRVPALDGLRGDGGFGLLGGAATVALAFAAWGLLLWRGTAAMRWLLLLIPLDLVLPVLTTGFVGRYAYFAGALAALVLGLAAARPVRRAFLATAGAAALIAAWAVDLARDVAELRAAGETVEVLLTQLAAERESAEPGRTIALIDTPDHVGAENDVSVFDWGLPQALARRGVPGPWLLLRVDPCWTPSDHRALTEQELPAVVADPRLEVLRYDARIGMFMPWAPR